MRARPLVTHTDALYATFLSLRYDSFLLTKFICTEVQALDKGYEDVHAAFYKILKTLQPQLKRLVTASPSVF